MITTAARAGVYRRWQPSELLRLFELKQQGLTKAAIGYELGRSYKAVKWALEKHRALSPAKVAERCREIVATMPGHEAHRALDLLTNDVLRALGYGEGIRIFETAVADWHRRGLPYPNSGPSA